MKNYFTKVLTVLFFLQLNLFSQPTIKSYNLTNNSLTAPTAYLTYTIGGASVANVRATDVIIIYAYLSENILDSPVLQISGSGVQTISATNMTKVSPALYSYTWTVPSGSGTQSFVFSNATDSENNVIISTPTNGTSIQIVTTTPTIPLKLISAGFEHSGAILTGGIVKVWGYNTNGQLGQGHMTTLGDNSGEMAALSSVNLGANRTAKAIASGAYHTAVILDNGKVKVWGHNGYGQLGKGNSYTLGDVENEMGDNLTEVDLGTNRTATQIACGSYFTAVLLDNGQVKVWGSNTHGQLGKGNLSHLGDGANEMGNYLLPVDLGTSRTATAIDCGVRFMAVILDNGQVKVWGQNSFGQLGKGHTSNLGNEANEMGDYLTTVDLGSGLTAIAIACGEQHTAALLNNGQVKAWGYNSDGELGKGNITQLGDHANEMGNSLTTVDLGSGLTATAIACGAYHTAVLLNNGQTKIWGYNYYGQLGNGNTNNLGDGPNEMGDSLPVVNFGTDRTATAIACGAYHTIAYLDDYTIKTFGNNNRGQLGLDNTNSSYTPVLVANYTALPVELKSFQARQLNGSVILSWITATESANFGFDVERKTTKSNWEKIGFVKGNGTSTSEKYYTFKDDGVKKGKYSYRLKQIDRDGTFEYHKTAEVAIGLNPTKIVLDENYPNPFNSTTVINYQIPKTGNVEIKLFNLLGKEIVTIVNEIKEEGFHEVKFNSGNIPSGVYYYKLQSNNQTEIKKMVLMK